MASQVHAERRYWRTRFLTWCQIVFRYRAVSQVVEQAFGTLKHRFRRARSRYLTCRNVEAELTLKAMVMNLLKAANRIDLVAA